MTIGALLEERNGEVVAVEVGTPVKDAVASLADRRIGAMPVLDDGQLVGIFSERDVIYGLRRDGAAMLDWPVERVMTAPPVTVERNHGVLAALGLITRRRIRHLPVVENGRLVGFVSIGDLVKRRIDGIEREAMALREYITRG